MTSRSAEEAAELEKYHKDGVKQIANVKFAQGGVYAVAFRPDGKVLAAAGADGMVRLINPETGSLVKEFAPVTVKTSLGRPECAGARRVLPKQEETVETEALPKDATPGVAGGSARGDSTDAIGSRTFSFWSRASWRRGETLDVTRMVEASLSAGIVELSRTGLVRPRSDGKGDADRAARRQDRDGAGDGSGLEHAGSVDFVHDVAPVLSRLGCNAGTCHGSAQGKNGFKLSLRGYDPIFDVRA